MLTKYLPAFTGEQVSLVVRLMHRDKEDLFLILQDAGQFMPASRTKDELVAMILRLLASEPMQRSLCQHDAAMHFWFGFDPPKVGATEAEEKKEA